MAETLFAPCDVVLAAEFDVWENVAAAEARVLFFLASWLEWSSGAFPLHLVCAGEPPSSVQALGAECGAKIMQAPERSQIRLCALEAPITTGRLLLVETDTLVLQPPERWDCKPAPASLLLTPASKPASGLDWPAIYQAESLPAPAQINSARAELKRETEWMAPYYQARSFWTSEPARLKAAWATQLASQADERVALTVAAAALGTPGRLPDACCARLAHWEAGALLPGETCLYQASGLFQGLTDVSEIPARIQQYGEKVKAAVSAGFAAQGWWTQQRARHGASGFCRRLNALFRRRVAPVLRASGAYV